MSLTIREAQVSDLDEMTGLLIEDGRQRATSDRTLWKMAFNAHERVRDTLQVAMENEEPPFRQRWLLAESNGKKVGIAHTILLPVPPIYAGEFGPPGLVMEDCFVADDPLSDPIDVAQSLLFAAETDLIAAGAEVLLGASVSEGSWEAVYSASNYEPLTLYLAKVGLRAPKKSKGVRPANADDVADIVTSSAENRQTLFGLDTFWKPHDDADARFDAWMKKSLTLADRDMFVSERESAFTGYAIAQPATPLHFPTPHDIGAIGVIDDYYHADFADPSILTGDGAALLLRTAEAALKARGNEAALVVCPAAWKSKIAVLQAAGYKNGITWFKKRRD